jgi:uncharacterized protein
MDIDWDHFTPWASMLGGLILGLAAAGFMLMNGRILGISGILAGVLNPRRGDTGWRWSFLLGLGASPWLYAFMAPALSPQAPRIESSTLAIAIAGLLVGFGTRLGSGCTSGHGVCGLSRLSPRSLLATLTFMLAGFLTVYVMKHML